MTTFETYLHNLQWWGLGASLVLIFWGGMTLLAYLGYLRRKQEAELSPVQRLLRNRRKGHKPPLQSEKPPSCILKPKD